MASVDSTKPLSEQKQNDLVKEVLLMYDKTERAQIDRQLTVTVNFFIQGLSSVNEVSMDYEITTFFRQVWTDLRLAYGRLTNSNLSSSYNVDSEFINQIWIPDLFIVQEKQARKHKIFKENVFLEIDPDGQVMLSQRLTIIAHCYMDFVMFPFDAQLCQLSIESYVLGYAIDT